MCKICNPYDVFLINGTLDCLLILKRNGMINITNEWDWHGRKIMTNIETKTMYLLNVKHVPLFTLLHKLFMHSLFNLMLIWPCNYDYLTHIASYPMCIGISFSWGMKFTTHLQLAMRLRKHGYIFMAWYLSTRIILPLPSPT